jgi:hypothetical protein
MAKKQDAETTPESGLVEQTTPETTPTGVSEEVAPPILNEPAPERVDTGYRSRDFITPLD